MNQVEFKPGTIISTRYIYSANRYLGLVVDYDTAISRAKDDPYFGYVPEPDSKVSNTFVRVLGRKFSEFSVPERTPVPDAEPEKECLEHWAYVQSNQCICVAGPDVESIAVFHRHVVLLGQLAMQPFDIEFDLGLVLKYIRQDEIKPESRSQYMNKYYEMLSTVLPR